MSAFKVLVLAVLAITTLVNGQGVPTCLQNSVAPHVAQSMKDAVLANPAVFATTSKSGIKQAFQALYSALEENSSPFVSFSGAGFDNKNFYGIQPLVSGYYLWSVRNDAAYGDSSRHFYLSATAPDVTTAAESRTTQFDPTARPWYKVGNGWATYQFAAGFSGEGRNGSTAYASFAGGVALADRDFLEPCGICYERSAAVGLARTLANTHGNENWRENIADLLAMYKAAGNKYITGLYWGTEEGRFYFVGSCEADSTSDGCKTGADYTVQVSHASETAVGKVNIYTLSKDGQIGAKVSERSYDPRQRPWYVLANGWTFPYKFASSDLVASTYAMEFNGGVVGVDRLDSEPCSSCATCSAPQPTPGPSPSPNPTPAPRPCEGGCGSANVINVNFAGLMSGMR